jgi:hypothetical protein
VKIEKIREALHPQPFRPFQIHLADGGRIPVEHEDFVALEPSGRELIVYLPDNSPHIVDVPLNARLSIGSRNGRHHRRKP